MHAATPPGGAVGHGAPSPKTSTSGIRILVMVLATLGLMLVVAIVVRGRSVAAEDAAKDTEKKLNDAKTNAHLIKMKAISYRIDNPGKCPAIHDVDPWGAPFRITCRANEWVDDVTVVSFGPDGIEGTTDDIRLAFLGKK